MLVISFYEEIDLIAAIVPAHNEEDQIVTCLAALRVAAGDPALQGEQTIVVVALDACTDNTRSLAQRMGVTTIALEARNVGAARALGAELALAAGARWLAFTDADTQVAPDWISSQLALKCEVVCGTVAVRDWSTGDNHLRRHHGMNYTDADGHRQMHGANFGISARAYEGAGGFRALENGDDVALVAALEARGASIAWSATPRVYSNVRRVVRAPSALGVKLDRVANESRVRQVAESRA